MSVSLLYLQVNTAKFLDIFNLAGVCMWLSRQKAKWIFRIIFNLLYKRPLSVDNSVPGGVFVPY